VASEYSSPQQTKIREGENRFENNVRSDLEHHALGSVMIRDLSNRAPDEVKRQVNKCRSRLHHGKHTMESDGPQHRALP
jgi:hypothetical protein